MHSALARITNAFRRAVLALERKTSKRPRRLAGVAGGALVVLFTLFYVGVARPPAEFPVRELVSVPEGVTLSQAATDFEEKGIVRSAFWLRNLAIILGGERGVLAGEYYFDEPKSIFTVARNITSGRHGLERLRVRILEGATVEEMADTFANALPAFNRDAFIADAQSLEGYLYPDTYFFLPTTNEKRVLDALQETFDERLAALSLEIEASPYSLDEVVTMASLLEREANDYETKRRIAGVLWTRLEIGMPLQVDAVFPYIIGKNTYELTTEDLAVDSPYNTYQRQGLPPTPIGSPSIESIEAALRPIDDGYLYYLADRSGTTYFSETFDEHKRKKALYLN